MEAAFAVTIGVLAACGIFLLLRARTFTVVLGLTLLGLIQASLQGIYSAALYRYAEAGEASVGFDQALLQQAFAPKKK